MYSLCPLKKTYYFQDNFNIMDYLSALKIAV